MSKSFVITRRFQPHLTFTLGVDSLFIDILELRHVDMSELSQEELETFQGIVAVLGLDVFSIRAPIAQYVLRYV